MLICEINYIIIFLCFIYPARILWLNSLCVSENPVIYPPPTLKNKFHTHFKHCRKGEEQIVKFPPTNKLQFLNIEVCNIFSCVYKYLILLSCQQINNIFYFTGASRTSYHSLCRFWNNTFVYESLMLTLWRNSKNTFWRRI